MKTNIESESIKTVWRFGYFKLFDRQGNLLNEECVSTENDEWHRLFWRFYWRVL